MAHCPPWQLESRYRAVLKAATVVDRRAEIAAVVMEVEALLMGMVAADISSQGANSWG